MRRRFPLVAATIAAAMLAAPAIAGKTYTFQARSRSSSHPDRKSKWSPKLDVETGP